MLNRTLAVISCFALCLTWCGCNQDVPVANNQNAAKGNQELTVLPTQIQSPSSQGNWQATKAILAGAPFPDSVTAGITLSLSGSEYIVSVAGEPDKGTCELDQSSTPSRMTIRGTEGPNKGKTFLAICDFPSSDEMRVCYDMEGAKFPADFTSTAKDGYFLVSYSRKE
jgi:uncharacterized protein (TIGR03067 family)